MGVTLRNTGRSEDAEPIYRRAIALKPDLAEAHYNLGVTLKELGRLDDAEASYKKAIALKPEDADAHCALGHALESSGRLEDAKASYKKAIEVKPDYALALWRLSGTAQSIPEAKIWIGECLAVDKNHEGAKLTNAALNFYQGDKADFINLMQSDAKNHPLMRSFSWVFSLPKLPSLYFHKWAFFDAIVEQSVRSRPFYEFGVWRGASFKYLIKTFKRAMVLIRSQDCLKIGTSGTVNMKRQALIPAMEKYQKLKEENLLQVNSKTLCQFFSLNLAH